MLKLDLPVHAMINFLFINMLNVSDDGTTRRAGFSYATVCIG